MTPENFCYWLQGFFEIQDISNIVLSKKQVDIIREHLQLVFRKETSTHIIPKKRNLAQEIMDKWPKQGQILNDVVEYNKPLYGVEYPLDILRYADPPHSC